MRHAKRCRPAEPPDWVREHEIAYWAEHLAGLGALPIDGTFAGCPFCKGTRIRLGTWRQRGDRFAIFCMARGCGAHGPEATDPETALAGWNAGRPYLERFP